MRKALRVALVAGLVLIVFSATVLVVGAYTFLTPLAEWIVARSVQDRLGLEERPQVELESDPAPQILAGKFSGGRISLGGVDLGDVRAERAIVDLDPFDLDVLGSVRSGALASEQPPSGTLRVEVSEAEVLRLMQAQADVRVRDVELQEDRVLMSTKVPVFGLDVSVQGSLALRDGKLVFEPRRLSALGTVVPERLLARANYFAYPLRGLPRGAQITGIEVAEGRLILSGRIERLPL